MTAKKTKGIICIGLLTVLVNAVSSELLYNSEVLEHIPEYTNLKGKDGEGELLQYRLINSDFTVKLSYNVDANGNKLERIRFDVYSAERVTQPGTITGTSNTVLGKCPFMPGIIASPRKCKNAVTTYYNRLTRNGKKSDCKWDPPSHEYCYTGMFINLVKKWELGPQFIRLIVMFYNEKKKNFIGVQMVLFETPRTLKHIYLMEEHDVMASNIIIPIEELSNLTAETRRESGGNIHIKRDVSWMKDVLDRAKFISSVKMSKPSGTHTDWYYAGALMVKPEIITKILQLDSRWEHHIRKSGKK